MLPTKDEGQVSEAIGQTGKMVHKPNKHANTYIV